MKKLNLCKIKEQKMKDSGTNTSFSLTFNDKFLTRPKSELSTRN